jgi:hypothetical protein
MIIENYTNERLIVTNEYHMPYILTSLTCGERYNLRQMLNNALGHLLRIQI